MDKIIQHPSTILGNKSEFLAEVDTDLVEKLLSIFSTLPPNAVGLAAPQIGVNKNMAIVLGVPMMNLEFTPTKHSETRQEGCFSMNYGKDFYEVERPKRGFARWVDTRNGKQREEKLVGLQARVFQHELDHINGKLCH